MTQIDESPQHDELPRPLPQKAKHMGQWVNLEPLSLDHLEDLCIAARGADASFRYLRYGPFATREQLANQIRELSQRADQPFWAVRDLRTGRTTGWLSLCDMYPEDGAIEVGSIWFSPIMQRSPASTEAVFLLMRYAMDELGYFRLVWRCSTLNAASMNAAHRYGFVPEGVWRRAMVVKGLAMDVAWFSLLKDEWQGKRRAIENWLRRENFSPDGMALTRLQCREDVLPDRPDQPHGDG